MSAPEPVEGHVAHVQNGPRPEQIGGLGGALAALVDALAFDDPEQRDRIRRDLVDAVDVELLHDPHRLSGVVTQLDDIEDRLRTVEERLTVPDTKGATTKK